MKNLKTKQQETPVVEGTDCTTSTDYKDTFSKGENRPPFEISL